MTATTALTAQNTRGVRGVHPIPSSFVRQQIEACIEDVGVDVVKTGMLAGADTIDMLANVIRTGSIPAVVVDPDPRAFRPLRVGAFVASRGQPGVASAEAFVEESAKEGTFVSVLFQLASATSEGASGLGPDQPA